MTDQDNIGESSATGSEQKVELINDSCVDEMINRVVESPAHFKHQQRGEPDLTKDEKLSIATTLFKEKPASFLSRFGPYLKETDLECFENLRGDYNIDFYIRDLTKKLCMKNSNVIKKNRRFEAMKQMMKDTDSYFSDENMKERDPFLYHEMIGQYKTDEEAAKTVKESNWQFSSFLMSHMEHKQMNELYDRLKDKEDSQREEEDESSDEEDMELNENGEEEKPTLSETERRMLENEFLQIMQQKFLDGLEQDFDYSKIDDNLDYDPVDITGMDEEEKYFDDVDGDDDVEQCSSSINQESSKSDEYDY